MPRQYASRRSVVMGFGGAVATSQPLAAQAGLNTLQRGGNAADAAIAAASVLNVVEPMSTGLGGDAFALVYWAADRRVYALNASGRAPKAATLERLRSLGVRKSLPSRGMLPVTVPGACAGWADLLTRFGRQGLDTVLQPAIGYANSGFPVSEKIAAGWAGAVRLLEGDPEARRVYLNNGQAPAAGQRFRIPDLAGSLRLVAEQGPDAFYRGPIAEAIVATSDQAGGILAFEDLAEHTSTWVEPIHTTYRGHSVYECPPNGQGIAALIGLNILEGYDLSALPFQQAGTFHRKMEAVKLAMTDAARYVADPDMADVPIAAMLDAGYARSRRSLINDEHAIDQAMPGRLPTSPDTVYLCTADSEGNAVSFINSLYMGFGSGIVAQGTGIVLQNRGHLFSLDPEHPNCIAPGKRPYHTIIPCMVTRGDDLAICFGVMGGFMQPQGHVQVLSNMLDHGMDAQRALDAPRFRYDADGTFGVESGLPRSVYAGLRSLGHKLEVGNRGNFGGGQVIAVHPESGAYLAGSDPRKDGCAVAY